MGCSHVFKNLVKDCLVCRWIVRGVDVRCCMAHLTLPLYIHWFHSNGIVVYRPWNPISFLGLNRAHTSFQSREKSWGRWPAARPFGTDGTRMLHLFFYVLSQVSVSLNSLQLKIKDSLRGGVKRSWSNTLHNLDCSILQYSCSVRF